MDTVEIIPNQTFKHGGETYEVGERYSVSEDDGDYFARSGWVGSKTPAVGSNVTLDVHDIKLGHAAEVG